MARRTKDPLAPLEYAVGLVWWVLVLSLVAVAPLAIFGTGSINGVGAADPEVCVEVSPSAGAGYGGSGEGEGDGFLGLRAAISQFPSLVEVCDPEPDTTLRVVEGIGAAISPIGGIVFFGWLRRILRVARSEGVFADRVPHGLSGLGALLIGWALVEWLGGTLLDSVAFHRMLAVEDLSVVWRDLPLGMLLGGLGLLSIGRVMAHAVVLRRDVEATI